MASRTHDDQSLRDILSNVKTIAVVGASDKPGRDSHHVMEFLQKKGYRTIPVNPMLEGQTLLGEKVYGSLEAIPEKVDMVDIFRNSEAAGGVVDEALKAGIDVIWMQLGVVHEAAAERAEKAGAKVIMDHCAKIEITRLGL